jgi:2-methylcitrate dehydratase
VVDQTTERIVDFVHGMTPDHLTHGLVHQVSRRLVDSLGCAVGAIDSPPARIARGLARDVTGTAPATVLGLPRRTSLEMAVFANTVMVRYLDFNDMYFSPRGGGGHPSDLIPTALAVGETVGASGRELALAIIAGYEVHGKLIGAVRLRERGWDQGLYTVIASAMIAGKLLRLSKTQLGHAVALAVTPNVPMRQTRVGELSMWKGCATAGAAKNGVFAALLAARGMTGPPAPFEGGDALWQLVTGPFEVDLAARPDGFVIEQISTKFRPLEYNAQGPVDLMLRLRRRIHEQRRRLDVGEIDRIDVGAYWLTYSEIGSEPEKWDPQTRETADHSLPYLLAVALLDGEVGPAAFTLDRIRDPRLRPLMQRIHIVERSDFTRRFPAELMCSIAIHLRTGDCIEDEIAYPHGHVRDPLTDAEIDQKFDRLVQTRGETDAALCRRVRAALWTFDTAADVATMFEPLGGLRVE